MLTIEPNTAILGASIRGIDLSKPIDEAVFGRILWALGRYGVLRFPDQKLDVGDVKHFSELFGKSRATRSTR